MYLPREEIIKRSIVYAGVIITLTAIITFLFLSSQDIIAKFLSYQFQIIATAVIVLSLGLFVQYRQATESSDNAKLFHDLEVAHQELAQKNNDSAQRQKDIARELRVATTVQQAIINRIQPDLSKIKIAARLVPATNIGGDFYAFFTPDRDDSRFDIVIGDVAGHGISSSFVTVLSIILLSKIVREESSPAIILLKANAELEDYLRETTVPFVTLFFGSYFPEKRLLRCAKGGHPSPLLRHGDGQWEELDSKGVFLGTFSNSVYEEKEVQLNDGDILVFYTDGLTESRDANGGEMYGSVRIQQVIDRMADQNPWAMVDAVYDDINIYTGEIQSDDRTLLILRV